MKELSGRVYLSQNDAFQALRSDAPAGGGVAA